MKKVVGVIGAGPAGLNAIRHSIKENFDVIAFEQNDDIGGQWYATGAVGKNKFGIDAHSSIYENLVINLAKELMIFPDFPYDKNIVESFVTPDIVWKYFDSYAETFELRKFIKFEHHVLRVRPLPYCEKWEVIVKDLPNDKVMTYTFDYIFVCIGLSSPHTPKVEGIENFQGRTMHSHDYRKAKMFENERISIVGSGFSALDIVQQLGDVAEKIYWVRKIDENLSFNFEMSKRVVEKPAILKFTSSGAEFIDGSIADFTTVIFATGFNYNFPFLSVDSGLSVFDRKVYPLYKHCLNINKPSLAIIGLPFFTLTMPMFDLQTRFCLEFWTERKALPNKKEMLADTDQCIENGLSRGLSARNTHFFGPTKHTEYNIELAKAAEIEPYPLSICRAFDDSLDKLLSDYQTFRNFNYKLLNDEEFEVTPKDIK